MLEYKNIPILLGTLVSAKVATLHELSTVYSLEDAYKLLEVLAVDGYNAKLLEKRHG